MRSPPAEPRFSSPGRKLSVFALAAIVLLLMVQVALPARAWAIPSDVRWTGEGHRFSWRMRLSDSQGEGRFNVTANGQEWIVDPTHHLTRGQSSKMLVRPDLIHRFAHYLQSLWEGRGYASVTVRADIVKSLNGRPMQRYIDPSVDLFTVAYSSTAVNSWVLPLNMPLWGAALDDQSFVVPAFSPSDLPTLPEN